jgi:hypothetical protein
MKKHVFRIAKTKQQRDGIITSIGGVLLSSHHLTIRAGYWEFRVGIGW